MPDAPEALDGFLAGYDPAVAGCMREALARLAAQMPGAERLVYDSYNALAVAFGPSERTSEAVLSLAAYPRWVSLFFVQGAALEDPAGLLKGEGARMRHVRLQSGADVDAPEIAALITQAVQRSGADFSDPAKGRLVVRSVSKKQRPRRAR